jgi:quinol monooxygenase YgiN
MIAVIAKLVVQEGQEEAFKAAGAEMVAAVRANEPGTLQYTLVQSQKTANEFYFFEIYADADAQGAHRNTPHMTAFGGKIGGILAGRPEITLLNVVAQ